jgi:hypothetical protein
MATFKIYGAHAETGKDVQATVQAESPAEAEAIATHRRIMVERVVEVETASEVVSPRDIQLIEATGKRWKKYELIGAIGVIVSVVLLPVAALLAENYRGTGLGLAILFGLSGLASFVLYLVGRIGAWWFHG